MNPRGQMDRTFSYHRSNQTNQHFRDPPNSGSNSGTYCEMVITIVGMRETPSQYDNDDGCLDIGCKITMSTTKTATTKISM